MHVRQPIKYLVEDRYKYTFGLVSLDKAKQIISEDFENHARAVTVRTSLDKMAFSWMCGLELVDFGKCSSGVLGCRFDDFRRCVPLGSGTHITM